MSRRPLRWEDRELDFAGVVDEIGRLVRRAKRRKLLVAIITVALAAWATTREVRKQRTYPATVLLSATESVDASVATENATAKLQDYIWYAVFTDRTLLELMERHNYRPEARVKNPRMALESFREDLSVDVFKNEFSRVRYTDEPPRSARIAVGITMNDPDLAVAVARDLGDLVIKRDAENRAQRFEMEQRVRTQAVSYAETDLGRLHRERAIAEAEYPGADPRRRAELRVKLENLVHAILRGENELKDAVAARRKLELESSADRQSLSLAFERVDWGAPKARVDLNWILFRTLFLSLFGLFPVVTLGVGAFDPRVYDERDVGRLGLRPLGLVRKAAIHNAAAPPPPAAAAAARARS